MATNALVTGPPRAGKSTAIRRTVDRLADEGLVAGGVVAPEVREDGDRVGFEIRAVSGDRRALVASVEFESGPAVGKYRVDVGAIDRVCEFAFPATGADFLVVDEVAAMQLHSDVFVREVRAALDADRPVLAAVQQSDRGFVAEVRDRDDARTFAVTPGNRDEVPRELAAWVRERVEDR